MIEPDAPVLVVSPHLDDAVLSAFAFLCRPHTTVLTVFCGAPDDGTASNWDRTLGQYDGAESMRTRVAEDEAVLGQLGVPTTRLPLLEAGYRDGEMDRASRAELLDAVQTWLTTSPRGVVLVPAGAGARDSLLYRKRWHATRPPLRVPGGGEPHPDHLAVRDLLVPALVDDRRRVGIYEELPYRWTGRGDRQVAALGRHGWPQPRRFHLPVDTAAKGRAVEQYSSQTPELFRPWVKDIASVLPDRERYWLLAPA